MQFSIFCNHSCLPCTIGTYALFSMIEIFKGFTSKHFDVKNVSTRRLRGIYLFVAITRVVMSMPYSVYSIKIVHFEHLNYNGDSQNVPWYVFRYIKTVCTVQYIYGSLVLTQFVSYYIQLHFHLTFLFLNTLGYAGNWPVMLSVYIVIILMFSYA